MNILLVSGRPGGVFYIIYKFGLSSNWVRLGVAVEVGLGLRLIMASIVLALLLVRFVWLWPQTNQLTAINLTSVASMEGLSRVSLDYLTFNFWLQGGEWREGTALAKCSARAVSKLLSQITRISDATRSTGFSVLLKLRCQMLECFYFSISTSTSTFISTLSLLLFSFYMYFYFEWISVAMKLTLGSARIADNSTKSHKFLGLMNTSLKMNTHAYICR